MINPTSVEPFHKHHSEYTLCQILLLERKNSHKHLLYEPWILWPQTFSNDKQTMLTYAIHSFKIRCKTDHPDAAAAHTNMTPTLMHFCLTLQHSCRGRVFRTGFWILFETVPSKQKICLNPTVEISSNMLSFFFTSSHKPAPAAITLAKHFELHDDAWCWCQWPKIVSCIPAIQQRRPQKTETGLRETSMLHMRRWCKPAAARPNSSSHMVVTKPHNFRCTNIVLLTRRAKPNYPMLCILCSS